MRWISRLDTLLPMPVFCFSFFFFAVFLAVLVPHVFHMIVV